MKRIPVLLFALCALLLLSLPGCMGQKGSDGSVYLRYSWTSYLYTYDDNTPLHNIQQGVDYEISPGAYEYSYECREYYTNGTYSYCDVWGTFSLVANEGKDGGIFWQKGDDGAPKYYTLSIGWGGASLEKPSAQHAKPPTELNGLKGKDSLTKIDRSLDNTLPVQVRTITTEGCTIVYRYRMQEGVGK